VSEALEGMSLPRWAVMWGLSFAIYGALKGVSWGARTVSAPAWKQIAYLFGWPGMDVDTFLAAEPQKIQPPAVSEWAFAWIKLDLGLLLVAGAVSSQASLGGYVAGWIGMIGIAFTLHFGLFHVLSCIWRRVGIAAIPIMNWPILSVSLTEFWGQRWNLAFRDLTHRFVFTPLAGTLGPLPSLFAGFLLSGLVHDLVISVPAGGGWGLPTLYFAIQGAGIITERSRLGRGLGLRRGWPGRLFCVAIVVLPCPLLFHAAFVNHVMVPFLSILKVSS